MDSEKPEKIFDIDGYLGKTPEDSAENPSNPSENAPVGPQEAPEGTPIPDTQNPPLDTAKAPEEPLDPVQLKFKRNRIIVASVIGTIILIAGVFVLIDLIDKHNFRERSRETYELTLKTLDSNQQAFNDAFRDFSYKVYGLNSEPTQTDIYPTAEQMTSANHDCLRHFNIDTKQFSLLQNRDKQPEDYVEANGEYEQISNNYQKATKSLELCRQDILAPIVSAFQIDYGEMSFEESGMGYRVLQPSKIGYVGDNRVQDAVITFTLYNDKGENQMGQQTALKHSFDESINSIKQIEFDPYLVTLPSGIARQNIDKKDKAKYATSETGVYSISGHYVNVDE